MTDLTKPDALDILRLPLEKLTRDGVHKTIAISEAQLLECAAEMGVSRFSDLGGAFLARSRDAHASEDGPFRSCVARDRRGRCWVFLMPDTVGDRDVLALLDLREVLQ